ncbi:S8 family peptidase [Bacillus toyonensis]|uniref:S8 family peptidase n=1 Tax=Bacillus toyonensis TaxID=155322 RepID=UPI000BFCBB50|nr:S8 family peptidase [Bacillus toyonensis]MED2693879.1 S8 family peptidase [Bacillus toyonensis]PHC62751.1 peptidase S8 [Bacillus toyonensis]
MRLVKKTEQIPTNIDPRLQRIIEKSQRDMDTQGGMTTLEKDISVIAKVNDIYAWSTIPGVLQTNDISMAPDKSGRIVTAKVAINELENIQRSKSVLSLKAVRPVKPLLKNTIEEIYARSDLLPSGAAKNGGGQGVVIGIVDDGCDFAHQNFQNEDKSTRILAIWDQSAEITTDSSVEYGRVFTSDQINSALNSPQPYKSLGYPSIPFDPEKPRHGTHVMDIAAGNGRGTSSPGVAPNADIVFVQLFPIDIPWTGKEVVNSSFGDSKRLLDGIKFIFDLAGERPCVINLSQGTNGGSHDGTSLVEQGIDGLVMEKPNRAVVISAGNSFNRGIHAEGLVPNKGCYDFCWKIMDNDLTFNELEIWYKGEDEFLLELINPEGDSIGKIKLGENGTVLDDQGNTLVFMANRKSDPNNGDNEIGVFLEKGIPTGTWTIRLHGIRVYYGTFHAWIERDPFGQSSFIPPYQNTYTLDSISCGHKSIVVGSYDAHFLNAPISTFSSAGPTRDGRQKPEISAPGQDVIAAASGTLNGVTKMSGTSMSAPAVAGVIALVLAEAQANGINLNIDQIREVITKTARRIPPVGEGWNDRYGLGRIDASKAVTAVTSYHFQLR